jgi:hypothetical protein
MTAPVMTTMPLFMRWIMLEVTDKDGTVHRFECAVTQAGLTSTGGDVVSLVTLCPTGSFSESTERVWSLVVTGVQDVESADSFQIFLLEHDGEEATFTYYPKTDSEGTPVGRGFKGTVTIAPPDTIGNTAAGAWATFQATMGLKGKYTMVDEEGNPTGGPATGATAGSPGTWSPMSSQPPADLASAPPLTGQPAWANDQYVQTQTAGTPGQVTWDGTAWEAYTGPHKNAAAPSDMFPSETAITAQDATNAAKLPGLGYVATPLTPWTAGQGITTGAHTFHWGGSAWTPGNAAVAATAGRTRNGTTTD